MTITEARQSLLHFPEETAEEPVVITKRGKPVLATLSWAAYESLLETLEILSDTHFYEKLQRSVLQAEKGKTISLEHLKKSLG